MKIPSPEQAERYLQDAARHNPGPWVSHSTYVAQAGQILAQRLPGLDPEAAYCLGLLHDIGRRVGVTGMRHVLDGYTFLTDKGYPQAARICLTHSFPVQNIASGSSQWDCSAEELEFIRARLAEIEYDDYDRLFQLCDALALPHGYCLLEKRWVDVAIRYGHLNEFTVPKWQAVFRIKADIEAILGHSIYQLLPGVIENTFS